jgi:lysozyme
MQRPSRLESIRKPLAAIAIGAVLTTAVVKHEGFSPEPYHATRNESFLTIGYGSTKHPDGSAIKPTDTLTRKQAEEYMKNDLESYKRIMQRCVKVPLLEREFNAYASLAYNIGPTAFCNSTLVRLLNQGDYQGACKQILRWDKQAGKPLKGLTIRRQEEYKVCIGELELK